MNKIGTTSPSEETTREEISKASCIYVANFGVGNRLWPRCLANSNVETFSHASALPFTSAEDKEGFIQNAMKHERTARGIPPTRLVASRWYNVSKIFESTARDLWIHRADDDIWWTISLPQPHAISFHPSHAPEAVEGDEVYHTSKPAKPWSRINLRGQRLSWKAAHPKARHFLATEATLQQLSDDYAAYAVAMILGDDLSSWHERPEWKKVASESPKGEISISTPRQNAAARMSSTACNTTKASNGQKVQTTVKNKNFEFASQLELEEYILDLLESQEGLCAISGMTLQYDGQHDDSAMLCSLDRIDSDGHYARGNLQVVCRFINEWKSNEKDEEFRRLLRKVREFQPLSLDL